MKVYGSYTKHYEIEMEVPDDATNDEIYIAVLDEIDTLYRTGRLEETKDDALLMSIFDENSNCVWKI